MIYKKFDSNIGLGFLGFAYNLGADFETSENYGTAHLMEHMICKSYDHMRSTLTRLSVDNNAYTSNNHVVFWFKGLNESLKELGQELYNSITKGEYVATREAFEIENKK
jgi:predicted Zn-dependent peptidase